MDNYKSSEFTFMYLMNKCLLLFKYIRYNEQKEILNDIKIFINNLKYTFSITEYKNIDYNIKKTKILEILIDYFQIIIDTKIYNYIDEFNKDKLISEIEKQSLEICYDNEKKLNDKKYEIINKNSDMNFNMDKTIEKNNANNDKTNNGNNDKTNNANNDKTNIELLELEKRINYKIKTLFYDIENNIKLSLKDYLIKNENIELELNKKIMNNNLIIENKLKEMMDHYIYNKNNFQSNFQSSIELKDFIKYQIEDIYNYINNKIKNINNENTNQNTNQNTNFENKILLLGNIFKDNIEKIYNNLNNRIIDNENIFNNKILDNEKDFINLIEERFNKYNFNIVFDKEDNEIKLYYLNELVTSSKINIKGLIGPKGPAGNKGDKGETPIIRKVKITEDNKIKFIIQENNNIYDIISDETIPKGPQGDKGLKGDPGKSVMDLKWNQENVMRIDEENNNSLIFLKSLCIGEKSHCLKENSMAINGGICYQNSSLAFGNHAKTLDDESIALFGSTIGKKSFSYRSDNVDENCIKFGKKEKNNYNINNYSISSKEIDLECDILRIKTNNYENNKFKEFEEKIIYIEKKVNDILKKI